MAYLVVTAGLRERLLASGAARIINTASAAHEGATLDFDDLQSAKSFGAVKIYGRSKLCNILFTRELARRLRDTGVTANCLHPGFVATRFADQSGGLISHLAWLAKFFAISPAEGAETIIYLASSLDVAQNDCGQIINPDGLVKCIEGNVVQGVSRTLWEEVTFDNKTVTSVDWLSYPILDITETPEEVDVVLINHPDLPPTGAGEPSIRPVAAAIANAIFDATGVRIRRVPFSPDRVKQALS